MVGVKMKLKTSCFSFKFGDLIRTSLGKMEIRIPTPNNSFLPMHVDVVAADVPLLIGLDILDKERLVPDNVNNMLVSKDRGWNLPITRYQGHMFLQWEQPKVLFTRTELHRLHLHFFHPNARKLYNLIRRARPEDVSADTLKVLEDIAEQCKVCKQHSPRPYRFRVAIPPDEVVFNHEVALDLIWLDGNPAIHVVDTQTHYQNAVLLQRQTAAAVWDAFVEAWASVYIGYPHRMRVDQGSVFTSKFWDEITTLHGIELQLSGVESHNSIGSGERYHAPLRRVFDVARRSYPKLDPEIALRLAVKGINDTMGPEGLVPTLLVYGSMPSFPAVNCKLPMQRERMEALQAARREMATVTAELRIQQALRSRLPPAAKYLIEPGTNVFVYREKPKEWKGPFIVTKVLEKEVFVDWDGTEKHFNKCQVIPCPAERSDRELERLLEGMERFKSNPPAGVFITEVLHPADKRARSGLFDEAKAKELEGLARRGVYEVVLREDVPAGANVMGGRFVLAIKNVGTGEEVYKARFVVQGHTDAEKNLLVHNSTNLKQCSVRVLVAIAAIFGFRLWSQDVSQAYLQSAEKLMREVYVRPTKEFRLSSDQLLRLLKLIYGLPDSGDYWHATFAKHLREDLMMNSTAGDLSLFFKVVRDKLAGLTGAYVDYTLGAGGEGLEKESLMTQEKFESKPREYDDFVFAGIQMEKTEDGFLMHQERYALKVELLRKDSTFSDFRSKRQELAWLANTRPDIAASVNLASQVTEGKWSADDVKHINGLVKYVKGNPGRGLLQQRLDLNTLSLRVFTDSSFANTPDLSSQMGFLILLCDGTGKCNVLHFASYKSKRVVRSVMGAEMYAFADGFDFAYLLKNDIEAMVGKRVPLTMMTDSESLFKIIVKNSTTTEKRLMIDIKGVRDAYDAQEISDVGWVNGGDNPADGLTKKGRCDALERLLDTGGLDVEVQQWVVRTPRSDS